MRATEWKKTEIGKQKRVAIDPGNTVLDVIHRYRRTEAVFKSYDDASGACICCTSLFDTLADVSEKYGIDLDELIASLKKAAADVDG